MQENTSVLEIKGIGDKTAALLKKLDIYSVKDLLEYYPRDYECFQPPVSLRNAGSGDICAIGARIRSISSAKKIRNLSILNILVEDEENAPLQLTFFNMPFLKKVLKTGEYFIFRGRIQSRGSEKRMEQPKYYTPAQYQMLCGKLQPIYALTKGITNQMLQKTIAKVLADYPYEPEFYPARITEQYGLPSLPKAFQDIHFPTSENALKDARQRLVFDEFFGFLLLLKDQKNQNQHCENFYPMLETADTVRFLEQLPFPLTKAQRKVWGELKEDLAGTSCMNRLIQGDVGSGKTILAVLALLMCAANGYQGALMAPTEVLAVQHYETIRDYIQKFKLRLNPILLVGSMTASQKKAAYEQIAAGEVNLVIGTHALIQEKVHFKELALVVTDEQHRFGVKQREKLAQKGDIPKEHSKSPHVLVMSATPIPRTLAMILYGDLHISVVDELPANRLPIKNCVVNTAYRPKAYAFIAKEVAAGRQVYVICPQVEAGELEDVENVMEYTDKLRAALPATIRIEYLHGKMTPASKNRIMDEYANHHIDVLVSTTVIEVGINVPNATVMMVENAERFGLAQLHQLRGRVGRGEYQSYCIFISTSEKKETMERLEILNHSNDGFEIAAKDLKLRGPGELFGVRQSGEFAFRMGDIYADSAVLVAASQAVEQLYQEDPLLEKEEHLLLRKHFLTAGNVVDFRSI